jgi:IS30 family transposase
MKYKQLTEGQRYQIFILKEERLSQAKIAQRLKVHPSTISRELKRNISVEGYQPKYAHQIAFNRRKAAAKYKISNDTISFVEIFLRMDWSPEQISAVGKRIDIHVSHEWIYNYVAKNKQNGGDLYKHLRQGHKRYRRGRNGCRSTIPNAVSIELRPEIVETRERFGDWEADTVLGKQGTGCLVTLAERKSRNYLVCKVPSKEADVVAEAIISMLKPYKDHVHTITFDNGGEFAAHEKIAKALEADMYFAHPYSSWERGLNENFNGLLRQYIPKGTDLRKVTAEYVAYAERKLNLRPRKCLKFRQPKVIFEELLVAA